MNERFLCKCGHAKSVHNGSFKLWDGQVQFYCWGCFEVLRQYRDSQWIRYCVHDFIPDNLAYLEMKAAEVGL